MRLASDITRRNFVKMALATGAAVACAGSESVITSYQASSTVPTVPLSMRW